ncbi:hypothetical protein [Clostridium ljungdahlii]|uniref:Uncharacterized protein n=1 Tax=Clostridium ljungdahlii TaxID=1538 RepID=A0A168NEH8_9CLOT|nr:hypothetical protein [Clostridium ljungdahlii]OAA86324.1 hypothetical protein WY13_02440 [Clostridium ljungdahlii]
MTKKLEDKIDNKKVEKSRNDEEPININNNDFGAKTQWKVYSSEKGYQVCGKDTHSRY